ncbi:MAG: EAL domain-containing protein [Nostoc sp. NMS1]|nr:EAL domain-containing protein [Nostoc sp. NMS1]MBN3992728.1 EAL domain-containing protein [Nostoc sp. NMS2]
MWCSCTSVRQFHKLPCIERWIERLDRSFNDTVFTFKIDRFFVSPIDDNGNNLKIVETLITLAHKLSLDVTIQGVETRE